jgi:carnitine O-acetyltransferase
MFAATPYRKDQPKSLSLQKSLPRLPVPALQSSFDRYIQSLKPLLLQQALESNASEDSVSEQVKKRQEWVQDFIRPGGLGKILQERLKGALVYQRRE